jgi:hypothetical protein
MTSGPSLSAAPVEADRAHARVTVGGGGGPRGEPSQDDDRGGRGTGRQPNAVDAEVIVLERLSCMSLVRSRRRLVPDRKMLERDVVFLASVARWDLLGVRKTPFALAARSRVDAVGGPF